MSAVFSTSARRSIQGLALDALPEDVAQCHELIRALARDLADYCSRVDYLARKLFGRRSERLDAAPGQLPLFGPEAAQDAPPAGGANEATEAASGETPAGQAEAEANAGAASDDTGTPVRAHVRHGRKPLPADLPRVRVEHDLPEEQKICAECGTAKQRIGEETSEQLDYVPASLHVVQHVCHKYACPRCQGQVAQAEKPAQPIEKGLAGPGLLAAVITSKYGDHLPLHRQESILARHGVDLPRSTLCDWAMCSAETLEAVWKIMARGVIQSDYVQSDDTGVPILIPHNETPVAEADAGGAPSEAVNGRAVHRGYLWVYLGDDNHPYTVYDFTWTRGRQGPDEFLKDFKGYLQADAYAGYNPMFATRPIVEVGCWAHARRKFFEAKDTDPVRANQVLIEIRKLYDVEKRAKEQDRSPDQRRDLRRQQARPVLDQLFAWLKHIQTGVLPKSPMGGAIAYALNNDAALRRYTDAGQLQIDNNASERALRRVVLGRKNWLFCGSQRGGRAAAILYSLVESARRHGHDPFAYLRDLLCRIPTHPQRDIGQLLPDKWKPPGPSP